MAKKYGYARVSTQDQNLDLQRDALHNAGADVILEEKQSGTKTDRPKLQQLLEVISEGDTVIIYKLDRMSRSTKHMIELADFFEQKGVSLISIQDKIDTTTPMGRFFFRTMASIAELERDIIAERTRDGLAAARARGRVGGRPAQDSDAIHRAIKLHESNEYTIKEIASMTGVSKSVLYRALNDRKKEAGGTAE